jgi:hypothetical protein
MWKTLLCKIHRYNLPISTSVSILASLAKFIWLYLTGICIVALYLALMSYCTLYKCESPYKRSDTDHVCCDSLTFNCVGREGPWNTPSSSLSPPKLVINSTFVFFGSSGDRERDLDDEDFLQMKNHILIYDNEKTEASF